MMYMNNENAIYDIVTRLEKLEKENNLNQIVKYKKLYPDAICPKYQRNGDAGFDFYAFIDNDLGYEVIPPKDQKVIKTGISCSIPDGYEIQIRPRSGLAFKHKITITNSPGTIDSGYTIPNEIMIIVYNLSDEKFIIKHGDRIAQGVLSIVYNAIFKEVEEIGEEDVARNRGGGFGSTGVS